MNIEEEEKALRQQFFSLIERLKTGHQTANVKGLLEESRADLVKSFKQKWKNPLTAKAQDKARKRELPVDGDVFKGSQHFTKHCASCHTTNIQNPKTNVTAPYLADVYGSIVGSQQDFKYSEVAQKKFFRWNRGSLTDFILHPENYFSKNKCAIPQEAKTDDVAADISEFLKKMGMSHFENARKRTEKQIPFNSD